MPFTLTFDTQDAAPEAIREQVIEKDGKWVFEGESAAEVTNLKGTLKKERDGRTRYEAELKRFERFKELADADETERDEFFERWAKRNEQPPGKGGRPDGEAVETLKKLHAKELKKRDDELTTVKGDYDKARTKLNDFELWTPLREIFISEKVGGNAADWELAKLDLANQRRFGFDGEGDDRKIVVMEDGHPSTVSPEKFFKEVYSDLRPKFYKAAQGGGSGAANLPGTQSGSVRLSRTDAKDPNKYRAAKERAAKAGVELQLID